MAGPQKNHPEEALLDDDDLAVGDDEAAAIDTLVGTVGIELYREAVGKPERRLSDASTWLLSLAVNGIHANLSFESLVELARRIAAHYEERVIDLAAVVAYDTYERLRRERHGEAVAGVPDAAFRAQQELTYHHSVAMGRK